MKFSVEIFNDLKAGRSAPDERKEYEAVDSSDLPAIPRGLLHMMTEADKSDPLNQLFVVYLRADNFGARLNFAERDLCAPELAVKYAALAENVMRQVWRDYLTENA